MQLLDFSGAVQHKFSLLKACLNSRSPSATFNTLFLTFKYPFFRNIGFSNELPLLGLANRLMAIKDEDKALEAILQCLDESNIQVDDSRKAGIIANYR